MSKISKKYTKFFWLKLKDNFFANKFVKSLRKQENGAIKVIIYIKLQLLSLKNIGVIHYSRLEEDFIDEIAMQIEEEKSLTKDVVLFLQTHDLILLKGDQCIFNNIKGDIATESESRERVAKYRARMKIRLDDAKKNKIEKNTKNGLGKTYTEDFNIVWEIYPKRTGGNSKHDAFKKYMSRIKEGVTHEEIYAGVKRYLLFCDATNKSGTEYVKMASTFLGSGKHYLEKWGIQNESAKSDKINAAAESLKQQYRSC